MAYTKTVWVDEAEPSIDAEHLNKMEQGIYDAQFPGSGQTGQMLVKTDTGYGWADDPESALWGNITGQLSEQTDLYSELTTMTNNISAKLTSPTGGTAGQYLQKTSTGSQWATIPTADARVEKDVTLLTSGWADGVYTITDSAIGANSTVFLTYPASTSDSDFETIKAAGIRGTAQAAGSLTIKATGTVPASGVTITLIIWG